MIETKAQQYRPTPPTPRPQPKKAPDHDVHLVDRLAVLYRYRLVASSVFVLTAAVVIAQGYTRTTLYQAHGRLLIEPGRAASVPGLKNKDAQPSEDPQLYDNTRHEILEGRDLTRRVIMKLDIASSPEFDGTAAPPRAPVTMATEAGRRILSLIGAGSSTTKPATP